jgi:hypothetical protein
MACDFWLLCPWCRVYMYIGYGWPELDHIAIRHIEHACAVSEELSVWWLAPQELLDWTHSQLLVNSIFNYTAPPNADMEEHPLLVAIRKWMVAHVHLDKHVVRSSGSESSTRCSPPPKRRRILARKRIGRKATTTTTATTTAATTNNSISDSITIDNGSSGESTVACSTSNSSSDSGSSDDTSCNEGESLQSLLPPVTQQPMYAAVQQPLYTSGLFMVAASIGDTTPWTDQLDEERFMWQQLLPICTETTSTTTTASSGTAALVLLPELCMQIPNLVLDFASITKGHWERVLALVLAGHSPMRELHQQLQRWKSAPPVHQQLDDACAQQQQQQIKSHHEMLATLKKHFSTFNTTKALADSSCHASSRPQTLQDCIVHSLVRSLHLDAVLAASAHPLPASLAHMLLERLVFMTRDEYDFERERVAYIDNELWIRSPEHALRSSNVPGVRKPHRFRPNAEMRIRKRLLVQYAKLFGVSATHLSLRSYSCGLFAVSASLVYRFIVNATRFCTSNGMPQPCTLSTVCHEH